MEGEPSEEVAIRTARNIKRARPRRGIAAAAAAALALTALAATGCVDDERQAAGAAEAVDAASLDLRAAPWLDQADGSPVLEETAPWPSLRFPAGTTYQAALQQLYVAAAESGRLPASAELAEPLPREVVVVEPDLAGGGIRLSLTAPWGWTEDTHLIRPPSVALPGSLAREEVLQRVEKARAQGRALPEGARVDAPALEPCQLAVGDVSTRPPCR